MKAVSCIAFLILSSFLFPAICFSKFNCVHLICYREKWTHKMMHIDHTRENVLQNDDHHDVKILTTFGKVFQRVGCKLEFKIWFAALSIFLPSFIVRKKARLADLSIFVAVSVALSVFNATKQSMNKIIQKLKIFQASLIKHSVNQPLTNAIYFKNENVADQVTKLGILVNIALSILKFFGGVMFNSVVLIADAAHSLSDLVSDFITLWAIQISRIPADDDHPFGHGKFESVGSLFVSLALIATGQSIGFWAYAKLKNADALIIPSWQALILAAISIICKEWLFIITKRVGDALNSHVIIANAWHHRSDAFSSILSLVSIAIAILFPNFIIVDSAAGILLAGIISLTGIEILADSIKHLTDTMDRNIEISLASFAIEGIEGFQKISKIRSRGVGNKYFVDLEVVTDSNMTVSENDLIIQRLKTSILSSFPEIIELSVKIQSSTVMCPLLSSQLPTKSSIEKKILTIIHNNQNSYSQVSFERVAVHYLNSIYANVELYLYFNDNNSKIFEILGVTKRIETDVKAAVPCVLQMRSYVEMTEK